MRPRFIAPSLALLALLVAASVAVAGGWAQVKAENVPVDPPAGEETTIRLEMLQHGQTPVSWPRLTVVATDEASGAVVRAEAEATGPEGSYVVTLVFPSAGAWALTYDSPDLLMAGRTAVRVAPPLAAAPGAGTPAEATQGAQALDLLPIAIALLGSLAVLAIGALALRGRGTPADRVTART